MFLLVTIYIAKSNAPYRHKEVVFSERGNILSGCGNQLNEPIARMPQTALIIISPSTTTRYRYGVMNRDYFCSENNRSFCFALNSVGVKPVNFLKTVLKVVLELNPASKPTERIVKSLFFASNKRRLASSTL